MGVLETTCFSPNNTWNANHTKWKVIKTITKHFSKSNLLHYYFSFKPKSHQYFQFKMTWMKILIFHKNALNLHKSTKFHVFVAWLKFVTKTNFTWTCIHLQPESVYKNTQTTCLCYVSRIQLYHGPCVLLFKTEWILWHINCPHEMPNL